MGQEPGVTEVQYISPPPPPGGRRGDGNVIESLLNFKRNGGSCGLPHAGHHAPREGRVVLRTSLVLSMFTTTAVVFQVTEFGNQDLDMVT